MRLGDDRAPFRRVVVRGRWAGGRTGGGSGHSPRSLANCQCGFWLGGRPRASGLFSGPAACERSDLDLTPTGRGSPLTPFPFSLPLRPRPRPGPFYSSYSESACQSVSLSGSRGGRLDGSDTTGRQKIENAGTNSPFLLLPLRSMIFRNTIWGRFFQHDTRMRMRCCKKSLPFERSSLERRLQVSPFHPPNFTSASHSHRRSVHSIHSISGVGQNQKSKQKWLRHPIFPECDNRVSWE